MIQIYSCCLGWNSTRAKASSWGMGLYLLALLYRLSLEECGAPQDCLERSHMDPVPRIDCREPRKATTTMTCAWHAGAAAMDRAART